jgi:ribulose-5-phosphate 4-epimerase/fuculose-1-phosphate aldolase
MLPTIPRELDSVLHSHADRGIAAEVLAVLNSTPATCAAEVSQIVGCSYVTAEKHLAKTVTAGLAVEKKLGKIRVFIAKNHGIPTGGIQE